MNLTVSSKTLLMNFYPSTRDYALASSLKTGTLSDIGQQTYVYKDFNSFFYGAWYMLYISHHFLDLAFWFLSHYKFQKDFFFFFGHHIFTSQIQLSSTDSVS